jgi:hypothetical protein
VPVFIFGITLTPKVSAVNATAKFNKCYNSGTDTDFNAKNVALMQQLQTLLAQQQTNQTPQNKSE